MTIPRLSKSTVLSWTITGLLTFGTAGIATYASSYFSPYSSGTQMQGCTYYSGYQQYDCQTADNSYSYNSPQVDIYNTNSSYTDYSGYSNGGYPNYPAYSSPSYAGYSYSNYPYSNNSYASYSTYTNSYTLQTDLNNALNPEWSTIQRDMQCRKFLNRACHDNAYPDWTQWASFMSKFNQVINDANQISNYQLSNDVRSVRQAIAQVPHNSANYRQAKITRSQYLTIKGGIDRINTDLTQIGSY